MSVIAGNAHGRVVKTFPAELDQLYEMLGFVKEQARALVNPEYIVKIELAMEEVIVNIITHGYSLQQGSIEIACMPAESQGIKIIVKDQGIPYNPLVNANKLTATMPKGGPLLRGYGIYFILRIMDEVEYNRENECNCLTLVKYS